MKSWDIDGKPRHVKSPLLQSPPTRVIVLQLSHLHEFGDAAVQLSYVVSAIQGPNQLGNYTARAFSFIGMSITDACLVALYRGPLVSHSISSPFRVEGQQGSGASKLISVKRGHRCPA